MFLRSVQSTPLRPKRSFLQRGKIGKDLQRECGRCSVKVSACRQEPPTEIQMALPEHRQWGLHRSAPRGHGYHASARTHWIFNPHEIVGGSWVRGRKDERVLVTIVAPGRAGKSCALLLF